ncbi:MAG TPA: M28 family metallopeptidase [Pyrinomonadaceae bacterium]|jgi:Zn-dependent M28 family amino/carboxypeptidase|nr:M28 family metallopeptidase [Pyrinomonadaceae bacterium]
MSPSANAPRAELCGTRARSNHTHALLLLLLALPFVLTACGSGGNQANNNARGNASPAATASPATTAAAATETRAAFDGERAFGHVRKMVEMGPRPAGSAELARTREYLSGELQAANLKVTTDEFTAQTPAGARRMVNLTAELAGESTDVIIVASHYDTKPVKEFRFVGANDGGSSTGALVEIARALAAPGRRKPHFTYWFVFFDGEEAVCREWSECTNAGAPDNTYGSRRYVARLAERGETKRVRAMILLDMIGYTDLSIPRETLSTPWLVDTIWATARELGHAAQFTDEEHSVEDDHIPFLRAEIPVVDLIQLGGYPYWHTAGDTLDKISPRSLQIVGETVVASLPRIEQRLAR